MKQVKGNLISLALAGEFDVIIHGCNCFHTMGSGIAKEIRANFPEAYQADLMTAKGYQGKLGSISHATVVRSNHQITVVNGYTQFDWRGNGIKADYEAIRKVMKIVRSEFGMLRIGYPMIGAGLAKGHWPTIEGIINEELGETNHTLVIFQP